MTKLKLVSLFSVLVPLSQALSLTHSLSHSFKTHTFVMTIINRFGIAFLLIAAVALPHYASAQVEVSARDESSCSGPDFW